MRRRDFLSGCGLAAAALALPAGAARAADEANLGLLVPHLLLGREDPWEGAYAGGFYLLRNQTAFNRCVLMSALPPLGVTPRTYSIDVHPVGKEAYTGAGLVFNREDSEGPFLAVMLQPNRRVGLYVYEPANGLGRLVELQAGGLRDDLVTRLSVENSDDGIAILTNGVKAGAFTDVKLKSAAGIIAIDIGDYYFANFLYG